MPVRESSGTMWRLLHHNQILALAGADNVYGVGSRSKLKYVVLQVPVEQAEEVICSANGKQTNASQTMKTIRKSTERDGRTFMYTIYQHHSRCLAWNSR